MAYAITAPLHGDFIIGPGNMYYTLADQTATTTAQQFTTWGGRARAANWIGAMLYLKTFVVGSGTVYPIFTLEAADNLAMTTNPRVLAVFQPFLGGLLAPIAAIPGTNPPVSTFLEGFCADAAKQYTRIAVTFNGTSSGTFDVAIFGV